MSAGGSTAKKGKTKKSKHAAKLALPSQNLKKAKQGRKQKQLAKALEHTPLQVEPLCPFYP